MSSSSRFALAIISIFFVVGIFGPIITTFGLFERKQIRIINQKTHDVNFIH